MFVECSEEANTCSLIMELPVSFSLLSAGSLEAGGVIPGSFLHVQYHMHMQISPPKYLLSAIFMCFYYHLCENVN